MTSSNYLGCLVFLGVLGGAFAHTYLFEPPSRNYLAYTSGKEGCPHCMQAGGPPKVSTRGKGTYPSIKDPTSHGLCGDPAQDAAEPTSIKTQKYMRPQYVSAPQRTYKAGDLVTFKVGVTAHHYGHYEFRICDRNMNADTIASAQEGQDCLNKVLLKKAPRRASCGTDYTGDCQRDNPKHPERWYVPPPGTKYTARGDTANWDDAEGAKPISTGNQDVHTMTYVIPADLQCTHCTLQWYLATGNTCAYDQDYFDHDPGFKFWAFYKMSWATCATSCCTSKIWGEEFWNCADIAVTGGTGGSSPTPPAPTPPAPMPAPTPTPMPTPMPTPPGSNGADCPAVCNTCKAGGSGDGGVALERGQCTQHCSSYGYCGKSAGYTNGGTDCTKCNTATPTPTPPGNKPEPEPEPEPEPISASSKALYNQVDGNNDGVLTPAEFAFWSQARGVVAKACQDDEDFKDPLGYSCADWDGYCFTKLLDYASDYTPQDVLNIIYNCPKTCDASCQEGSLLEINRHEF